MSQNRLGIASVVLVVLLGLTFWRMNAREAEVKAPPKVEITLPKIERDKIDELEVSAPDKDKVVIKKQGDDWMLTTPLAFKANQDAVKTALDKLGELEVTGIAATNAANHERLEVDAKKGTHVIARSGGKPVIDAWIGIYASGNTMLRLAGQTPVATVKGSIRYAFARTVLDWRDRTVSKLETKDVREIVFDDKNGRFDFVREGDDWKQVTGKREKAITPLDQTKVKGFLGTACAINANDFADSTLTPGQAGLGAGAATVTLKLSGDAGAQQVVFRLGNEKQKDQTRYLQREGVATLYVVSKWIADRLMPNADSFVKKDAQSANGAKGPVGSPGNPIPVEPVGQKVVQLPPGHEAFAHGAPAATTPANKAAPAAKPAAAPAAKPAAKK